MSVIQLAYGFAKVEHKSFFRQSTWLKAYLESTWSAAWSEEEKEKDIGQEAH